jgi:hypothetical protein
MKGCPLIELPWHLGRGPVVLMRVGLFLDLCSLPLTYFSVSCYEHILLTAVFIVKFEIR